MSVSEELARLAELRDKGVLSEDEFQAQKAAVLAGKTAPVPPAASEKKKPGAVKIGCLSVFAIVVALIIIGLIVGPQKSDGSASSPKPQAAGEAARDVTPQQLADAYSDNEAAAQKEYGDQTLRVSGTVAGVDLDIVDNPFVKLRTSNEFMPAQADLTDASKPKASTLHKGQQVTMICRNVSEVIGTPMLHDCDLQD